MERSNSLQRSIFRRATKDKALKITKQEILPRCTGVFQVDDGTLFYWKNDEFAMQLYVKWMGIDVHAALPDGRISGVSTHGNALYFFAKGHIYKAIFIPSSVPARIEISHLRTINIKNEFMHPNGLILRSNYGQTEVYKSSDDPNRDGIPVDLPDEDLKALELRLIHRGKAVFLPKFSETTSPTLRKLRQNVIVIESPSDATRVWARDNSPFLYFCRDSTMFTLDTETMEFLPPLKFDNSDIIRNIVSVRNGQMTVKTSSAENRYFKTTQLPKEYVRLPTTVLVNKEALTIEGFVELFKELRNNESTQQNTINDKNEQIQELQTIVKQLTATVDERNEQTTKLRSSNEQSLSELRSRNSTLVQEKIEIKSELNETISELRRHNTELMDKIVRIQKLEELRKAELHDTISELRGSSIQLGQEKTEMQKTMDEMAVKIDRMSEERRERNSKIALQAKLDEKMKSEQMLSIFELQKKNSELSVEYNSVRHKHQEELAELNKKMDVLRIENQLIVEEKECVQKSYEESQAEISKLKEDRNRIADTAKDNSEQQKLYEELEEAKDRLESVNEELEEREEMYNVEKANLELNNARLREIISELKLESEMIQKFKSENEQLNKMIELQKKNLELSEEMNKNHQVKHQNHIEEICELRETIADLESSIYHLRNYQMRSGVSESDDESETIDGMLDVIDELREEEHSQESIESSHEDDDDELPPPPSQFLANTLNENFETSTAAMSPVVDVPGDIHPTVSISPTLSPPYLLDLTSFFNSSNPLPVFSNSPASSPSPITSQTGFQDEPQGRLAQRNPSEDSSPLNVAEVMIAAMPTRSFNEESEEEAEEDGPNSWDDYGLD